MSFDLVHFINEHEQSFHKVFDLIPIPLFAKDVQGKYLTCNKAYEDISGKSRQEMIGKTVYDLWPKSQAELFFLKDKELFDTPGQQIYEADISASFGKKCIVQFHKVTFSNKAGETIGLLGAIFNLTEKKELEEKLKKLSEIDDLTGLLNRRTGMERMNQVLHQGQRHGHDFVIAVMDIDHFKSINDTYGHETGDKVLKEVNQITSEALRDYDILLRYGGEEFVLCFPETNVEEARIIVERIRTLFEKRSHSLPDGGNLIVTVSVGIAAYPNDGKTIDQLINAGDKAMYQAKSAGRNCIRLAETPRIDDQTNM